MRMLRLQKDAGHVVVAYGFKKYKFYKNNSLFRTDNYLVVCMGDGTEGYLSIIADLEPYRRIFHLNKNLRHDLELNLEIHNHNIQPQC